MTNNEFIAQVLAEAQKEFVYFRTDIHSDSYDEKDKMYADILTKIMCREAGRLQKFLADSLTASAQNAIESIAPGDDYYSSFEEQFIEASKRYFV